jgi:hypothetical protein
VYGKSSELAFTNCVFGNNGAVAGDAFTYFDPTGQYHTASSGLAEGGAIFAESCTLTMDGCKTLANQSEAVYVKNGNSFKVLNSSFDNNVGVAVSAATGEFLSSSFTGNLGGALRLASGHIDRCQFLSNEVHAVKSGTATGGAISAGSLEISASTFVGNRAVGGDAWISSGFYTIYFPAGAGGGGAIECSTLNVTNSIFFGNSVRSGDGMQPVGLNSVPAFGAALAINSDAVISHCSFASNIVEMASFTDPTLPPRASAIWAPPNAHVILQASAISGPQAPPLVSTNVLDGGYNVSADETPPFTEKTSINKTAPLLNFF